MDRNHLHGRSAGAEGLDHHLRSTLPEPVYYFGRTSGRWKDSYYYVGQEVLGRVTRISHRSYLDEDGQPCGLAVSSEEGYRSASTGCFRVSLHDPLRRRVDRVYARIRRRTRGWLDHLLRRGGAI